MLDTKKISNHLGISVRHIRRLTKAAKEKGLNVIAHNDERFVFEEVSGVGGRGFVYAYTPVVKTAIKPKRRVSNKATLNPLELPVIDDLNKPTTDEKLALVTFYHTSDHPLSYISQALIMTHCASIKSSSLEAKIKRWSKAFKKGGKSALEDKRGGKDFKADLELVQEAILGAGAMHNTSRYLFYCHLYAKRHNVAIDYKNPSADISESAFNRAVKHIIDTRHLVKEYLRIGQDAFVYAEPSFGRTYDYPNQQWEVDATPLDIMAKVPHNDGIRDYTNKEPSEDYHLVRAQLIRVIDNCSGASVCGLFESSNSYANVRLIYKALSILGKPEIIKGDNGADYVSEHLQSVIADLSIDYIATGKARGDEKCKIERSFRTLQHSREFESLPGFIGHNVGQRQQIEAQASTKLEKLSGVATNVKGDFMWWWELENWIDNFLAHKDADKYEQHTAASDRDLINAYRLLGKRMQKKVSSEGIRHRNTHYLSFEMWQHIQIGDTVQVIENIDNSSQLFLYNNDQFICEINDKRTLPEELTVEEIKASKKAYKQRVVKDVKSTTKKAQKAFNGYQNAMRDEFLDLEAKATEAKKHDKKQQDKTGFDPQREYMKLISGGRAS